MRVKLLAAGLALLGAAPAAAFACQGKGNPLLDDNFKTADPGWGRADSIAAFTDHGLVLKPPPQGSAWRYNQSHTMAHADWCVEIVNPPVLPMYPDEDAAGSVGVWFWGQDSQNFYTATITLDGKASIDRLIAGKWQDVVPPAPAPGIKTAPNAVNELELVSNGNSAQFFVNGNLVTQIEGKPPPGGGSPGIYGESGANGTTWTFPRVRLY